MLTLGVLDYMAEILTNLSIFCYINSVCLAARGTTWIAAGLAFVVLAYHTQAYEGLGGGSKENISPDLVASQELQDFLALDPAGLVEIIAFDVDLSLSGWLSGVGTIHKLGGSPSIIGDGRNG
eukprot:Protomagalhaensia_sp_Gyna_25__5754@NODE_833_length_2539_cov_3_244000_g657_i0_p4_GENE_NODE_833_length_2539_cov_3_244000_g657_i0NODE_833_length_2539_cov_3_244000_g657_i0_p4_ORF_typecomplete_len123_score10_19_NODE_833_length_2539_cov_3_244000_g657_i06421010